MFPTTNHLFLHHIAAMSLLVHQANMSQWPLLATLEHEVRARLRKFTCDVNQLFGITNDRKVVVADRYGVRVIEALSGKRVVNIVCTEEHCLVLTEHGQLWGFERSECDNYEYEQSSRRTRNAQGTVGANDEEEDSVTVKLLGENITSLDCGEEHALMIDNSGRLVGFKFDDEAETITPRTQKIKQPKNKVVQIACGDNHSLALTNRGEVYGAGDNDENQLGPKKLRWEPIKLPQKAKCKFIAAGGDATLLLTEDNRVHFGGNGARDFLSLDVDPSMQKVFVMPLPSNITEHLYLCAGVTDTNKVYVWRHAKHIGHLSIIEAVGYSLVDVLSNFVVTSTPVMLEWRNTAPGVIPERFASLFNSPEYSDLTFAFPTGETLHGHRCVLSIVSEYSKYLLPSTNKPCLTVAINQFSYEAFYKYLQYLYTGQLSLRDLDEGFEMLYLAKCTRSEDLVNLCIDLLIYHFFDGDDAEQSMQILQFAESQSLPRLLACVSSFQYSGSVDPATLCPPPNPAFTLGVHPWNVSRWLLLNQLDRNTLDMLTKFKYWCDPKIFEDDDDRTPPRQPKLYGITKDDRVIAFGFNRTGQLGLGHANHVASAQEIVELRHQQVVDIVCGRNHMMALTAQGALWGWGDNKCQQIGVVSRQAKFYSPQLVMYQGIISVKCGVGCTIALTANHRVLIWGFLWHLTSCDFLRTSLFDPDPNLLQVTPLELPLGDARFVQIECGAGYSLALTDQGQVYGWGKLMYQEVDGHGPSYRGVVHSPFQYQLIFVLYPQKRFKSIACAQRKYVLVTMEGEVIVTCCHMVKSWKMNTNISFDRVMMPAFDPFTHFIGFTKDNQIYEWHLGNRGPYGNEKLYNRSNSLAETLVTIFGKEAPMNLNSPMLLEWKPSLLPHFIEQSALLKSTAKGCDLTFVFDDPCGQETIKVHRVMLASATNYMRARLRSEWRNANMVRITDCPATLFRLYIDYLYTGLARPANMEQALDLMQLAVTYRDHNFNAACCNYTADHLLTLHNCVHYYGLAFDRHMDYFLEKVAMFMYAHQNLMFKFMLLNFQKDEHGVHYTTKQTERFIDASICSD